MQDEPYIEIPLKRRDGSVRAVSLIDAADETLAAEYTWCLWSNGYVCSRRKRGGGDYMSLHRLILGLEKGDRRVADHVNRDRLDNRRANLRVCTPAQNNQNVPKSTGTSKYRGVMWHNGAWEAHVFVNRRAIYLGRSQNEEEAAEFARAGRVKHLPFATD